MTGDTSSLVALELIIVARPAASTRFLGGFWVDFLARNQARPDFFCFGQAENDFLVFFLPRPNFDPKSMLILA